MWCNFRFPLGVAPNTDSNFLKWEEEHEYGHGNHGHGHGHGNHGHGHGKLNKNLYITFGLYITFLYIRTRPAGAGGAPRYL